MARKTKSQNRRGRRRQKGTMKRRGAGFLFKMEECATVEKTTGEDKKLYRDWCASQKVKTQAWSSSTPAIAATAVSVPISKGSVKEFSMWLQRTVFANYDIIKLTFPEKSNTEHIWKNSMDPLTFNVAGLMVMGIEMGGLKNESIDRVAEHVFSKNKVNDKITFSFLVAKFTPDRKMNGLLPEMSNGLTSRL